MNPSHSDENDFFSFIQASMPTNLPANIMIHAHAFPKKGLQKTKVQICEQNLHKVYQTKSATAKCTLCTLHSC